MPEQTTVIVVGGGIVGLTAALNLAERGVPVVVLEKGRIVGEQSSRNLGWIRKMGRSALDVPLAQESDRLWREMRQRTGADVGYRQNGIVYVSRTEKELDGYRTWLGSVEHLDLDSRILSPSEVEDLVPGGTESWAGGIYTPSDGYAEPTLAGSAVASAAIAKGAIIIENCAVRTLVTTAGKVTGVVTERGEIKADQVLLCGALWSRRFLANLGLSLPTLPVSASVIRTGKMEGPTNIAVGGPDFSFRKRLDGGFTITQRGALDTSLVLDHALIGYKYLPTLRANWRNLRLRFGREMADDLGLKRRWGPQDTTPFERVRTMDPVTNVDLVNEAMENLIRAWPSFRDAEIKETWAGTIDITPDSLPVISRVEQRTGLTLATGFSGHGFGTSPAAGQLAADLVMSETPLVDPKPYRLDRF